MQNFLRYFLLTLTSLVVPTITRADPYGPPFQVNATASSNLGAFDIATSTNGDVIVLWQDGPQGTGTGFIRRYAANGQLLLIQDWSVGTGAMRVAAGPAGNYAVLRVLPDSGAYSLFVTVYNRTGSVVVPQLRVNDAATFTGLNTGAQIAMNASGQFVVVWGVPKGGKTHDLYARRFNANGSSAGAPALVHSSTLDSHFFGSIDVALDSLGSFVVSWDFGDIFAGVSLDVFARRFNSSNLPLGPAIRVNTTTPGDQSSSRMAMNEAGDYLIVWIGSPPDGNSERVFGQRFSAAGSPLGSEFELTTAASPIIEGLDVAIAPDRSFVATWQDDNFTLLGQIVARAYSSAGTPLGSPFQVSSATNDDPITSRIAMDPAGNYMISWRQTLFNPNDFNEVYARRYSTSGAIIQPIANGQTIAPLAGLAGSWRYFKLTVPPGQATVDVTISGGFGDADLYTRWGVLPTLTAWDGRPFLDGNNEGVRMLNFPPGDWYIGINGFLDYSSLALTVSSH